MLVCSTSSQRVICLQTLRVPEDVSEQESVQVEVTRLLIESYFDIVRKNLQVGCLRGGAGLVAGV
jgi:hypothetical protein